MNLVVQMLERAAGSGAHGGQSLLAIPLLVGFFGRLRMCTVVATGPSGKWPLRTCAMMFIMLSGVSILAGALGATALYALFTPGNSFADAAQRLEEVFFSSLFSRANAAAREIMRPFVELSLIALISIWGAVAVWVAERTVAKLNRLWNELPHGGGAFLGEPQVQLLEDGRRIQLLADYRFRDARGNIWTTPAGTVVDGASIPRFFWRSFGPPLCGQYRNASIIHDYYCQTRNVRASDVHRMFYEACLAEGLAPRRARIAYWAVRRFGPYWGCEAESRTNTSRQSSQGSPILPAEGDWSPGRRAA